MSLPIPRFGSWATETNYPSGSAAWNGQPLKVQPVGDYFTPNVKPPAENLNWLLATIAATNGQLVNLAATIAVANWNPWQPNPQGASSGNTAWLSAACWDGLYKQWLVGARDLNASDASVTLGTPDGGKTWLQGEGISIIGNRQIGTDAGYMPIAMAVDPVVGTFCAVSIFSGACVVSYCPAQSTVEVHPQSAMAGVTTGTLFGYDQSWFFVGANAGTGTYEGVLATSTEDGGGTWANETSELPAAWQGGTSNLAYFMHAWNEQTDDELEVVFGMSGSTTSDTSRLLLLNAGTWTDVTPSVLTGKRLTGLAYSAFDGLWGILCCDAGSANLYTSPDLSTWTLVQTWQSTFGEGLATVGSVWALVLDAKVPERGNRIWYSSNVASAGGSSTWSGADYFDPYGIGALSGSAVGVRSVLLSSDNQLCRVQMGSSPQSTPGSTGGSVAISLKVATDDLVVNQPPLGESPGPTGVGGTILFALTTADSQQSATSIPPGCVVTRVSVVVTEAFSGGTTIEIGQPGSESLLVETGTVDDALGTPGTYDLPVVVPWGTSGQPVLVTLGGSPTEGAGSIFIEFAQPSG